MALQAHRLPRQRRQPDPAHPQAYPHRLPVRLLISHGRHRPMMADPRLLNTNIVSQPGQLRVARGRIPIDTATSVTISSLTADTEYTFQVRTVTTVGSSQSNPSVTETTLSAASTVPGAPTSLTPTAQTGGTSMALAWTVPTDTGSTAISDYDVSSDDGATWVSTGSTFTAYTVTGLDKGTEYTFRVRAVNSVGNGTASASVTETTLTTRPSPPTNLTVSVAQTTADTDMDSPNR